MKKIIVLTTEMLENIMKIYYYDAVELHMFMGALRNVMQGIDKGKCNFKSIEEHLRELVGRAAVTSSDKFDSFEKFWQEFKTVNGEGTHCYMCDAKMIFMEFTQMNGTKDYFVGTKEGIMLDTKCGKGFGSVSYVNYKIVAKETVEALKLEFFAKGLDCVREGETSFMIGRAFSK